MGASEAVLQGALLAGASTAGWFGTHLGVRATYAISGFMFVGTALLCRALLGAAPLRDPAAQDQTRQPVPAPVGELPVG
jgi:hypothetical protein